MSNDDGQGGNPGAPGISVITKVKPKLKRPSLYRVLILNDDYTPMEFVVHVLNGSLTRMWKRRPRSCSTSITTASANAAFLPTKSLKPR